MSHKIIPVQHSVNNIPPPAVPVIGYEGLYAITPNGQVFRVAKGMGAQVGKSLKLKPHNMGYFYVSLYRDGVPKNKLLHRLIAENFIPNPHQLPEVNHKNGNRADFDINNLEWVTRSQNHLHAYRILGRKPSPPPGFLIKGTNLKSGETVLVTSTRAAAKLINGSNGNISLVCRGKKHHCKGWRWEYV